MAQFENEKILLKNLIRNNILQSEEGAYIVAGGHQFKTLWCRDFCFSVSGLIAAGFTAEVDNSIDLLFQNITSDGQAPRGLDYIDPKIRVALATLRIKNRDQHQHQSPNPKKVILKPEYLGEHGTPALDSQLLLILAALQRKESVHFTKWQNSFSKMIAYVEKFKKPNGLIFQPKYSDWCDSQKRLGFGLYMNILYLMVKSALNEDTTALEESIFTNFYNKQKKLFSQFVDKNNFPAEAHFFILRNRLLNNFIDADDLAISFFGSELGQQPGLALHPKLPQSEISWTTQIVGLKNYHQGYLWSWLLAEQAMVARQYNHHGKIDNIKTDLYKKISSLISTDQMIYEIYESDFKKPVKTLLYQSESPFTWGLSKIYEALSVE